MKDWAAIETQQVNVRVVAATHCDLKQMVAEKQFRSDLYFRLNIFPVSVPPLRERREDIPSSSNFSPRIASPYQSKSQDHSRRHDESSHGV